MSDQLSNVKAMHVFKKYDMSLYEYYHKDAYFLGCDAKNYASYLLNKNHDSIENIMREHEEDAVVFNLWMEFGDVPMNPTTECIECEWLDFPIGTHREEIWHWFEEKFNVSVAELMYNKGGKS